MEADRSDQPTLVRRRVAEDVDGRRDQQGAPQQRRSEAVAEFVSDFRGLSSTIKRRDICEAVSASRETARRIFRSGRRRYPPPARSNEGGEQAGQGA